MSVIYLINLFSTEFNNLYFYKLFLGTIIFLMIIIYKMVNPFFETLILLNTSSNKIFLIKIPETIFIDSEEYLIRDIDFLMIKLESKKDNKIRKIYLTNFKSLKVEIKKNNYL